MAYKFEPLRFYLVNCKKESLSLSFEDIEKIIETELCKSARTYNAYWSPSKTHTMPNTIVDAGYKITSVDLSGERIYLERK